MSVWLHIYSKSFESKSKHSTLREAHEALFSLAPWSAENEVFVQIFEPSGYSWYATIAFQSCSNSAYLAIGAEPVPFPHVDCELYEGADP